MVYKATVTTNLQMKKNKRTTIEKENEHSFNFTAKTSPTSKQICTGRFIFECP